MPGMFLKFNQPELWLLTGNVNLKRRLSGPSVMQDQCNYSQCVFLLTFIMASTMQKGTRQTTSCVRYLMTFPISNAS